MRRAFTAATAAAAAGLLLTASPARAQEVLFTLPAGLTEVSGTATGASGALWVHEDSGSDPVLTALDPVTGAVRGAYDLGVDARDWEDMAAGPDGTLYVADVGDNSGTRERGVLVHVLPEPTGSGGAVAPARSVRLTYEDGPRDAEALLVHPRTGQVLLVTKFAGLVFAAPQPFADGVLTRVGEVRPRGTGTDGGPGIGAAAQRLLTGGAVSPDGTRVALRTYTDAYVWDVPGDDLVAALQGEPEVLPLPSTEQGEALAFTADGTALVLTTEGASAPVHRVALPVEEQGGPPAGPGRAAPGAPRETLPLGLAVGTVAVTLVVTVGALRWRHRRR